MSLWNSKTRALFFTSLYLGVAWAGGPLLPDLPPPVEPIISGWDRDDRPVQPSEIVSISNESPAVSGAPTAGYDRGWWHDR